MFGMAHSRRMGVISSTLPGLSRGGARTDVENEERGIGGEEGCGFEHTVEEQV